MKSGDALTGTKFVLTSKNIIPRPPKIVLQLFDVPVLDYGRTSDQRCHRAVDFHGDAGVCCITCHPLN